MTKQNESVAKVAARLAAAMLLKDGEISLADIRSLPFVRDDRALVEVVNVLLERFDATMETRKGSVALHLPINEDIVVLRNRGRRTRVSALAECEQRRKYG